MDLHDRNAVREYLDREIAKPNGDFCTYNQDWLRDYQRHVRRWMDHAPEGATFLVAPLQGWDGTPCTTRNPQGPWNTPGEALRRAYAKRGDDWMTLYASR